MGGGAAGGGAARGVRLPPRDGTAARAAKDRRRRGAREAARPPGGAAARAAPRRPAAPAALRAGGDRVVAGAVELDEPLRSRAGWWRLVAPRTRLRRFRPAPRRLARGAGLRPSVGGGARGTAPLDPRAAAPRSARRWRPPPRRPPTPPSPASCARARRCSRRISRRAPSSKRRSGSPLRRAAPAPSSGAPTPTPTPMPPTRPSRRRRCRRWPRALEAAAPSPADDDEEAAAPAAAEEEAGEAADDEVTPPPAAAAHALARALAPRRAPERRHGVGRCAAVLDLLCARDDAFWFAEPVNAAEVPDYALVISTPMDYATIRRKLRSGAYGGDAAPFADDCRLVFANAVEYNWDTQNQVNRAARRSRRAFEGWFATAAGCRRPRATAKKTTTARRRRPRAAAAVVAAAAAAVAAAAAARREAAGARWSRSTALCGRVRRSRGGACAGGRARRAAVERAPWLYVAPSGRTFDKKEDAVAARADEETVAHAGRRGGAAAPSAARARPEEYVGWRVRIADGGAGAADAPRAAQIVVYVCATGTRHFAFDDDGGGATAAVDVARCGLELLYDLSPPALARANAPPRPDAEHVTDGTRPSSPPPPPPASLAPPTAAAPPLADAFDVDPAKAAAAAAAAASRRRRRRCRRRCATAPATRGGRRGGRLARTGSQDGEERPVAKADAEWAAIAAAAAVAAATPDAAAASDGKRRSGRRRAPPPPPVPAAPPPSARSRKKRKAAALGRRRRGGAAGAAAAVQRAAERAGGGGGGRVRFAARGEPPRALQQLTQAASASGGGDGGGGGAGAQMLEMAPLDSEAKEARCAAWRPRGVLCAKAAAPSWCARRGRRRQWAKR